MEFGAGVFDELDNRYQLLAQTTELAPSLQGKLRFGLPQWAVREWKFNFYPPDLAPTSFLNHYSQQLKCVELSSTFYSDISDQQILRWMSEVPADFKFLPKWPKLITHQKGLRDCSVQLQAFLAKLEVFGDHLGTSILQLPPNYDRENHKALYYFLLQIPAHIPLTIEFRHSSWFAANRLYQKLEDYLRSRQIGTVISDTPARPDLFHVSFTGPLQLVRYLSDENDEHDQLRLAKWREWLDQSGLETAFCLHRPDNATSPQLIKYIDQQLWVDIEAERTKTEQATLL